MTMESTILVYIFTFFLGVLCLCLVLPRLSELHDASNNYHPVILHGDYNLVLRDGATHKLSFLESAIVIWTGESETQVADVSYTYNEGNNKMPMITLEGDEDTISFDVLDQTGKNKELHINMTVNEEETIEGWLVKD